MDEHLIFSVWLSYRKNWTWKWWLGYFIWSTLIPPKFLFTLVNSHHTSMVFFLVSLLLIIFFNFYFSWDSTIFLVCLFVFDIVPSQLQGFVVYLFVLIKAPVTFQHLQSVFLITSQVLSQWLWDWLSLSFFFSSTFIFPPNLICWTFERKIICMSKIF